MRVGGKYIRFLHTDSTTSIAQAGVLGDSYVDISSAHARGPQPANNSELTIDRARPACKTSSAPARSLSIRSPS